MVPTRIPACRGEHGIALVVALLVLLVISLLATVLMVSVNVDTKITSHGLREASALNTAEAGIGEALARIRNQDILFGTNPRAVAQIFNALAGSVPALGTDSTGLATSQPSGAWLNYSTAARGPDALTVQYRTNPARTTICRYSPSSIPRLNTISGYPIYLISSTGRAGGDRRQIQVEAIQKPINVNAKGAVVAQVGINFSGNSDVCGFNHRADTPAGTKGRPPCDGYELGYGHLPGAWSEDSITSTGSAVQNGNPPTIDHQTGFYSGPWDVFGMSQAEFFTWVGAPHSSEPSPPSGIYYLDDNGVTQDQSGAFAYPGDDGDGLLYVDGDMTINGNFTFRGLIYIEGDLKINGTCWILGGLVVRGVTTIDIANGDCTVLYSEDAINQNISKYGGQFVTLSWREIQ